MFEQFLTQSNSIARHEDAPYAEERARYLAHCEQRGDSQLSQRNKRDELYWAARILSPIGHLGVTAEQLRKTAQRWAADQGFGQSAPQRLIVAARPWLRFLGWWSEPAACVPFQVELDRYCEWIRSERGLTHTTIDQWRRRLSNFLRWYETAGRSLAELLPDDIDKYLIEGSAGGWCRRSVCTLAIALRGFLRYAGSQGWCAANVAETIEQPRIYQHEALPSGPAWSDVQRMLQAMAVDDPQEIRDRAIIMLLAVYGMRTGEVARLRLTDLDWERDLLRVPRLKRRAPQTYPLVASVGNSIAHYLREARPHSLHPEVFLGLRSPHRPLMQGAIYHAVAPRLKRLGCAMSHWGGHALRHACACRLVAQGVTLKEIGDHLGHRSASATRIYAKVDLPGLREVAAFDLGAVL